MIHSKIKLSFYPRQLYIFLLIVSVFCSWGFTQSINDLFLLYEQKDYISLKESFEKAKGHLTKAEQLFFSTIFIKDGEEAYANYKELFNKADGRIKYLAAERLKDYYYAKGYYSTASDYERYLAENRSMFENTVSAEQPLSEEPAVADVEKLYIQVGAFGLEDNANQMRTMLETQKIDSKIVKRIVNAQTLFCVWVIGKNNFQQTLELADELKQKYHLDYKIIKE